MGSSSLAYFVYPSQEDRPSNSVFEGVVIMQIVVATLMIVVAFVFIGIAMHAARNSKGRG